jgi:hypothetical protein
LGKGIKAEINIVHTVRTNDRVELILTETAETGGEHLPEKSLDYIFASLQVNRIKEKYYPAQLQADKVKCLLIYG